MKWKGEIKNEWENVFISQPYVLLTDNKQRQQEMTVTMEKWKRMSNRGKHINNNNNDSDRK